TCGFACNTGFADCDHSSANGCEVNLSIDPNNCGGCGVVCGAGQVCSGGVCGGWPGGQGNCNGTCVNLGNNVNRCGTCGNACQPVANAVRICANGTCGFVCNSGFADCDHNAADGCETNLNIDPNNCGACGVSCGPNQVCSGGVCTDPGCPIGWVNCNGT